MSDETRDLVVRPPVRLALAAVTLGGLFYVLGQYVSAQQARDIAAKREITVQGQGEVFARPDVARVTLGVDTGPQATAKAALELLAKEFTDVVSAVRSLGIKEEDVKATNVSLNPQYDYQEGRQTLRGFTASETIEVTIRDLDKISDVLARTTSAGANQIGNLSFDIDDRQKLEQEAEEKAAQNARVRAEALARALGVTLGGVKSFSTSRETPPPPVFAERALLAPADAGGPPVPAGSQRITTTATVTYEIR